MASALMLLFAGALAVWAQAPQNPSPMVDHTRAHPRLQEERPPGRRETLAAGTLFIPEKLARRKPLPLAIHFHGGTWLPEAAAARDGRFAMLSVQLGAGSGVYGRRFENPDAFGDLLREAEARAGVSFFRVVLTSWSAGYGAVRAILKQPENASRVDAILLMDGLHAGYTNGLPTPGDLDAFLPFAREAVAGRKTFVITHSEIFPGTFASTTETADWLLAQLGLRRKPVLRWGPMGMQQLSEARAGRFHLRGYAGNSAPDHVDQLHSLPVFLRELR